jgi:formylglycine-generating enzyme required for sulfatase activity
MRSFVIWSAMLLAAAGTANSQTKDPPKTLAVDLGGGVKMEMVLIPAGQFMMGDDEDMKPVHKVHITRPFYLGAHEVTQQQWEAVMGSNPAKFKGPKNPVEKVSWDDCRNFIEKLNAKAGEQGVKFALPTEAQWEYACRAGSTTKYCFGDDEAAFGEYAWFSGNAGGKTHPAGEKKPNAFGLYDMYGNVWEWCADWHDPDYYAKSPADDPQGPATGASRVFRGGAWNVTARSSGSAKRRINVPELRADNIGFRVARVPSDTPAG